MGISTINHSQASKLYTGSLLRQTSKSTIALVLVILVLVPVAIVFGSRWWTVGRFIESTDDAYVRADIVTISSRVAGYVDKVEVEDNQHVEQGEVLVSLDDRDYRARQDKAQAAVEAAIASIHSEQAERAILDAQIARQDSLIAQAQADMASAKSTSTMRRNDAGRYQKLVLLQASSNQRWEQAHADDLNASAAVDKSKAAVQTQRAEQDVLSKRKSQREAAIEQARARLAEAQAALALATLDLQHTVIRGSSTGVVGQRVVRPGQYVEVGMPLLAVVPLQAVYVIANFKETQIASMHSGQPVDIDVDSYAAHSLRGSVQSIAPGSGAEFALLPPDNATGNFTKVVQRIPVKIRIDTTQAEDINLRPGMSVIVRVHTHDIDVAERS